jgi:hypothetical protein
MVLHSATHLFHNDDLSQGLRDLADLDSLLRRFGQEAGFWEELPRRAAELDLARPLCITDCVTQRAFGTPCRGRRSERPTRKPRWLPGRLMDASTAAPCGPSAEDAGVLMPLSRHALYLRAHWLRMPPLLLARHLGTKAFRREEK